MTNNISIFILLMAAYNLLAFNGLAKPISILEAHFIIVPAILLFLFKD